MERNCNEKGPKRDIGLLPQHCPILFKSICTGEKQVCPRPYFTWMSLLFQASKPRQEQAKRRGKRKTKPI